MRLEFPSSEPKNAFETRLTFFPKLSKMVLIVLRYYF